VRLASVTLSAITTTPKFELEMEMSCNTTPFPQMLKAASSPCTLTPGPNPVIVSRLLTETDST